MSGISDKDVLVDWKNYEAVYGDAAYQLPTNIFLNPMKECEEVEVEVGTGKLSLIWLVTTRSNFAREEGTGLVKDQNADFYIKEKQDKSTGAKEGGPIANTWSCRGIEGQGGRRDGCSGYCAEVGAEHRGK